MRCEERAAKRKWPNQTKPLTMRCEERAVRALLGLAAAIALALTGCTAESPRPMPITARPLLSIYKPIAAEAVTGRPLVWITTQYIGQARPGERLELADQRAEQRGLAGTVGAEHAEHGALLDFEVESLQGFRVAEALRQLFSLDQWHGANPRRDH